MFGGGGFGGGDRDGARRARHAGARPRAFTLPELLVALTVLGVLLAGGIGGFLQYRGAVSLDSAASVAVGELARARLTAVSRREVVRLRLSGDGVLTLYSADEEVLARTRLAAGEFSLDSLRLAPRTLRFNARGQAAPGSVYLYRGSSGVRIVCNFLGRVRVERFRL